MLHFVSRRPSAHTRRHARFTPLALVPFSPIAPVTWATADVAPSPDLSAQSARPRTLPVSAHDGIVLPTVTVSAAAGGSSTGPALDPNLPASTETVTRKQFDNWNVVNTEDTLKYLPNLAVRKRFIGDLNSIDFDHVIVHGLDLVGSVAYTQSTIVANAQNPATVGKYFYRIPLWRADLAATYHIGERYALTMAARYSGREYNTLTNTDSNPNVFGGTSTYTVADAKFTVRPTKLREIGIGVDNMFDARYFVYHPYPGRTFYVEGRLRM